jgi:hypothetical protein
LGAFSRDLTQAAKDRVLETGGHMAHGDQDEGAPCATGLNDLNQFVHKLLDTVYVVQGAAQ